MKKIFKLVLLSVFAVAIHATAFSQMIPKDAGKTYQNGKYLKKTTVPSGSAVIPIVKTGGTEWEGLTIDTLYSQTQEIGTGSALPSAKASKVGNKYLYITSVDTTEMTYLGGNKWRADIIRGSSTPAVSVVNSGQTIDNSNAIWKNPNISVISGQTVDYNLQNGILKPVKGYLTASDYGMKGDGVTNDSFAFTKYLNSEQKNIILEDGKTYIIGSHFLKSGKNIIGNGATLKQVSTAPIYAPPILFVNSNCKVENTIFIGDITKGGEWSHGIYVTPDNGNTTDTVQNVLIQNNTFRNLRGDGVYVGVFSLSQKRPQNVTIMNNKIRNVIRNGISIVAGSNIQIESNNIDSVGYLTIDLESDVGEIIENVTIKNHSGRGIGVISSAGIIENIIIDNFKLNDSISNRASQPYIAGDNITPIILRNTKNVTFSNGSVISSQRAAIEQVGTLSNVSFNNVQFVNINKSAHNGGFALRTLNGAKFTNCRFQGNFRLSEYLTNYFERDTFLLSGNRLTYSGNSTFKSCYIEAAWLDDGIGGGLWENCELNMKTGTGLFRLGSYFGTPTLRNCIAYNNSNNLSIYPDFSTAIKIKIENLTLNGSNISVINGNGTATLPVIVKQSGAASTISIPDFMRADGQEIKIYNQTSSLITLTNNISGVIGNSNFYKFDTIAKFVGINYNSLTTKLFSDSCISGITSLRTLALGASETQIVTFGKTISSPQIQLTLKSDTVGSQSLMLATSTSTQFQYGVSNGTGGAINYQVIYRVCPSNGVGY